MTTNDTVSPPPTAPASTTPDFASNPVRGSTKVEHSKGKSGEQLTTITNTSSYGTLILTLTPEEGGYHETATMYGPKGSSTPLTQEQDTALQLKYRAFKANIEAELFVKNHPDVDLKPKAEEARAISKQKNNIFIRIVRTPDGNKTVPNASVARDSKDLGVLEIDALIAEEEVEYQKKKLAEAEKAKEQSAGTGKGTTQEEGGWFDDIMKFVTAILAQFEKVYNWISEAFHPSKPKDGTTPTAPGTQTVSTQTPGQSQSQTVAPQPKTKTDQELWEEAIKQTSADYEEITKRTRKEGQTLKNQEVISGPENGNGLKHTLGQFAVNTAGRALQGLTDRGLDFIRWG